MNDLTTIHKIKFTENSDKYSKLEAETYCGRSVIAFYPPSGYAMDGEAGSKQFRCSVFDKPVNCEKCKQAMNDD